MKPKRKVVLLSLGGVLGTLFLGAVSGAGKMLTTDLWPSLRPFVSTAWTWTLELLTWLAQPIAFPLWSFIVVLLIAVGVIGFLVFAVASYGADLNAANAKLSPALPHLNESAQQVLAVIAKHGGKNEGLYLSEIPSTAGLSQLVYEGAMDVLYHWNLISISYSNWGDQVSLSALGRAYVLHPQSPLAWVVKST
ncbi:hypothetical protein HX785_07385 [Pseudomonas reactans]|uniref:hypothetical protein n=1 Tax=Pseudomonas reactans TaxID=117680 RepID=UPI0015A07FAA|nr:hypothetical protein [Pseudomonas reactans]NWF13503.1 hypothetical protein [Pseudomonas reactans]